MTEEKKKGYPKIAQANWFGLRDKLKQRVPNEISASYVASAMGMAEGSARANVVTPLKVLGIIGGDSKPTDLAYDWRDDSKYPEVCEKIVDTIYPQELQDLFHSSDVELSEVASWFMRDAKVGEAAAKMFATTYIMLLQKKPEAAKSTTKAKVNKPKAEKTTKAASSNKKAQEKSANPASIELLNASENSNSSHFSPRLHIDVQVHISPESSPEQIDKIFESMSKHLRDFKS